MSKTYNENGKWTKSQDFTKLDELPEEIQQGIMDGTLSIELK